MVSKAHTDTSRWYYCQESSISFLPSCLSIREGVMGRHGFGSGLSYQPPGLLLCTAAWRGVEVNSLQIAGLFSGGTENLPMILCSLISPDHQNESSKVVFCMVLNNSCSTAGVLLCWKLGGADSRKVHNCIDQCPVNLSLHAPCTSSDAPAWATQHSKYTVNSFPEVGELGISS